MATYKIAPDTQSAVGLAKMGSSLRNKADYNSANTHTAGTTGMNTLVVNSTTYQGDLTSKTWDGSTPLKFSEMFGETWQDAPAVTTYTFTVTVTNLGDNCDKSVGSITVNGGAAVVAMSSPGGSAPTLTNSSFTATSTDTVEISVTSQGGGGAGCTNFDTDVFASVGGTTVISSVSSTDGTTTYSFTPSSSTTIGFTSTATY